MELGAVEALEREVRRREALQVEYAGSDRPVHAVTPAVSVLVVTYQHAAFLRGCLDGILAQHLDVPFEVVIGEDGSDDGTRDVCVEYADAHPDRIRLFLRDRATTQLPLAGLGDGVVDVKRLNGRFTRHAARAGVLAFCEGDDRWTDPTKLQRQLDVLRADPTIAVVTHRATVEWTMPGGPTWQYAAPSRLRQDARQAIWDRGTPTCTVMLRDVGLDDVRYLAWSCRTLSVDNLVRAVAGQHGDTWFIDRDMAVHRKHPGGLSQSAPYADRLRLARSTRNLYLAVRDLGPEERRHLVHPKLAGVTGKLGLVELGTGRRCQGVRHLLQAAAYAVSAPVELLRQAATVLGRLVSTARRRTR